MTKKKIIAIIVLLLLCTTVLIVYAAINNSIIAGKYEFPFTDVNESDWFYEDVRYVNENNLMNGTRAAEFSPNGMTTRGMIVTILWRLEGEPIEEGKHFDDVKSDAYYKEAISWASNNQIVSGYSETYFGPDDTATREQLATIIYRYAAYKKYDLSKKSPLDKYVDKNQISDYAITSIEWAHANGIITGTSEKTLSPKDYVQRCQVAAILKRLCTNIIDNENPNLEENDPANSENITHESGSTPSSSPEDDVQNDIPTIVVKDTYAKPGDEVQVFVEVKNNPGILGMTLTAYYDETKCSLQSVKNGKVLNAVLDFTTSKTLGSGARFVWDGIELSAEDIKDGEILVMTFKIQDDAKTGNCPVTLKYFEDDILDNNLVSISPYIKNGEIIILNK